MERVKEGHVGSDSLDSGLWWINDFPEKLRKCRLNILKKYD